MPFTVSHAVVALPFVRTPLAPAAIAVGAMTPDLPLFLRGTPFDYAMSHSFRWIPVTVLVAAALLLVWRCAVRPAARELAPAWLGRRLPPEWDLDARRSAVQSFARRGATTPSLAGVIVLAISLALGVVSHIAWDLFTHEGRWGSALLPVLDESWGPLPGYKWLQHGSSVFGLGVLAVWAALRLRAARPTPVDRGVRPFVRWAWWLSLPAVLIAAAIGGYLVLGPFTAEFTPAHLAYRVLPPACAVWAAASLLLCLVIQANPRAWRGARRASDPDDTPGVRR